MQALTFNNSPPSQESLPILPTNVDNIGLIDIKFTPSLDPTANLHNDTDTGFFFNFISSISAIDIGDSVFVMTAAKTYDSQNIQFLNVTDPESISTVVACHAPTRLISYCLIQIHILLWWF